MGREKEGAAEGDQLDRLNSNSKIIAVNTKEYEPPVLLPNPALTEPRLGF